MPINAEIAHRVLFSPIGAILCAVLVVSVVCALTPSIVDVWDSWHNSPEKVKQRNLDAWEAKFEEIKPIVLAAVDRDEHSDAAFHARNAVHYAEINKNEGNFPVAMRALENAARRAQGLSPLPYIF